MVVVVQRSETEHSDYGGGHPLIHLHLIERTIHGNHVAVKVWGEMKIAAKEVVFARELYLNTIQVLLLTPEHGTHNMYTASKNIYHKGELGNYASIDIFSGDAYQMTAGTRVGAQSAASEAPYDGSLWLNFMALGE